MREKRRNRIKVKGLMIAFLVSLAFSAVVCPCECAASMWSKTYGGTGVDLAISAVQTSDGGYAIIGYTNSSGAGGYDAWFVKTDADGNMQWNKTYGDTGMDEGYSAVQTSDGGYAIVGRTDSFGAGGFDAWLIKTDADGNMEWNMTYGGTGIDLAFFAVQTSDGGYAIAGDTNSSGAGDMDAWLIKTDAAGVMQWNKTYGGTGMDLASSAVQTSGGGYAITGYTSSFGAGGIDFWLVKTDADGNMLWNKTYGGALDEVSGYICSTSDGGYAIAGYTTSFGTGGIDAWLIKTDAAGNMEWNMTYGGTGMDLASSAVQTSDGGYLLTINTNSFGAGGEDVWLVKVDEYGVIPEGLTIGVMLLLSTVAAIVGIRILRKRPKWKRW